MYLLEFKRGPDKKKRKSRRKKAIATAAAAVTLGGVGGALLYKSKNRRKATSSGLKGLKSVEPAGPELRGRTSNLLLSPKQAPYKRSKLAKLSKNHPYRLSPEDRAIAKAFYMMSQRNR